MLDQAIPEQLAIQLSGTDRNQKYLLSVVAKRTYSIQPDGRCVPADEQIPLQLVPIADCENSAILNSDSDLHPLKEFTDVIVQGTAYNHSSVKGSFLCSFRIGAWQKHIRVFGERRCDYGVTGSVLFSEPLPIEKVPLRYENSYGGTDEYLHAALAPGLEKLFPDLEQLTAAERRAASPFSYPRNPVGRGYVISDEPDALASVALPLLEDERDLLTPGRLLVGEPGRWLGLPMPAAPMWVSYGWFPRSCFAGMVPDHEPPESAQDLVEQRFGLSDPATLLTPPSPCARVGNGAPLDLQLPPLRGDESVLLDGLHPQQRTLSFLLPGERPRLFIDGRETGLVEVPAVMSTLWLDPEKQRLSIVWSGSGPAKRPYLPEELRRMPFRVMW